MVGRITVIIPYYNRIHFLDGCLASVFAQACAPDEIVAVDDGSRPAERKHLDRFRIRISDQPRTMGVSAAPSAGVRAATGEWIAGCSLPGGLDRTTG